MTTRIFSELGLSPEVLKAIDKLGFEQASPIQAEAIPVLLSGRDVVGQSQTGSGKTAAFAGPAIDKVDPQLKAVQVLVLCPTRELAVQVAEEVHKLALFKRGIHALPIYGGQSYDRQFLGLRQGAQIVIGTPGRVMDHMRRGTLRLDKVKMMVLDEADVMLDMGFRDDIETILQGVPAERQTVFFSATMPRPIQELIQKYSRDPQTVKIERRELTVPTVEQVYYEVDRRFKIELLTRLIDLHDLRLGIIFCNTKRMVDDLVDHLEAQGYSADRLHGDMSQALRDRVMNKFRKAGLEFLVATDVAARGIDVDNVQVVFNYDLPYDAEDYLHRIGRTGRAGRSGMAISFAAGREIFQIRQIERFTKVRIHRGRPPTTAEVEEARANQFLERVRETLQSGEFKRQDHLIERLLEEGFTSTDIASALMHQLQQANAGTGAVGSREDQHPRHEQRPRYEERSWQDQRSQPERGERPDRPSREEQRSWQERAPRSERSSRPERVERPARPVRPPRPERVENAQKADEPNRPGNISPGVTEAAVNAESSAVPVPTVEPKASPAPAVREAEGQKPENKVQRTEIRDQRTEVKVQKPEDAKAAENRGPKKMKPLPPIAERRRPMVPPQAQPPRHSRRTPDEQTRLYINVGQEMGIEAKDVVGAILGETGLPANVVGTVDIRERHLFVDVAKENANAIISKLNRAKLKNQKIKVKLA